MIRDWDCVFFFFAQIARKSKDLIFSKNIDKKVRLDFEGFLTLIRITIDFSRVFLHCMNFYELKKIYMVVKWIITAFLFFKTLCIHILHSYGNIWNLKFKPPIGNNVECNRGSIENYNRINLCIQNFLSLSLNFSKKSKRNFMDKRIVSVNRSTQSFWFCSRRRRTFQQPCFNKLLKS